MSTPLDNRIPTTDFGTFPLNAVVAVDSQFSFGDGLGSGITIAPNHVLTVGHNAYSLSNKALVVNIRTTTSANQPSLKSRIIGSGAGDPGANVTIPPYFPKNYNTTGATGDDIALFRTSDAPINAADTIGLLAFVSPDTAKGLSIITAGYPAVEPLYNGTTLVISPGTGIGTIRSTSNDGTFNYTENVDTEGGQSGSGVWHILDGDIAPRVLGVHAYGFGAPFKSSFFSFGGDQNGGTLLTTDVYTKIVDQIQLDSGVADANILPENALVGSDTNLFSFLTGTGNDNITGSYRKERILGRSGADRLFGGGANDRLEGGDGIDQALFSDIFTNYTYSITDPTNKFFEFDHTKGTKADAKDSLKEIEFGVFEYIDSDKDGKDDDGNLFYVPLQVDPKNNTKLKDGPEINPEKDILDSSNRKIGTITVKSPAWTFDGDVSYSLTLGAKQGTLFNFAYIIDTSGSMSGDPLDQAKNAYQTLTQSLIDKGIAANSEFAVIEFNSFASLTGPINAATAISTINGLSAGGGTEFGDALSKAQQFFQSRNNNATNIAYFLSDGVGNGASESLQSVAEVRAFGIGGADLTSLNIIDSDDAVLLTNPSDLVTQFNASTVDKTKIDRIDVKLAGVIVDTITPDKLVVDALGRLSYDGIIDKLIVSRTAENQVSFELVFKDTTPTTTLNYKITSGQQQVSTQSNNGTKEVITFSVNQADFIQSALAQITSQEINGNDLANIITVGSGNNILRGNGGNDRFILDGGTNLVDGGDGIDTIKINKTQATAGTISKNGNIVNIGTETTLLNTEFIEFSDARLAVDTLIVTPIVSLQDRIITVVEGNSGSKTATFTINLS
jgi:von Willebrand factor type A domain/RTX calcium-binding nonapeptide repeat (4 copies)